MSAYAGAMAESRSAVLPEPVRLEDTRTSQDVESHPAELEDRFRETQWLLRASAG